MIVGLDIPPNGSDGYMWADYAELMATVHPDKLFSRGELDGIGKRAEDRGAGFDVESRWRLISDFHTYRANTFREAYPFGLSEAGDTLKYNLGDHNLQRVYLALLVASCMRNVAKKQQGKVAREFELLSYDIFSSLMPKGSEIRATWAHGGKTALYSGNLYDKLVAITKDIRGRQAFTKSDYSERNTGDGGIDLISWHPMGDERDGIPISFAQCGCSSKDWRTKQFDASPSRHRYKLNPRHPWANYYFMPIDLRQLGGKWAHWNELGEVIIVDRLRLMRLGAKLDTDKLLRNLTFLDEIKSADTN